MSDIDPADIIISNDEGSFVIDLEDAFCINAGEYFIKSSLVNSYRVLKRILSNQERDNYFRTYIVNMTDLERMIKSGKDLSGLEFILIESIKKFDDKIASEYGIDVTNQSTITLKQLNKLSNKYTKVHDGMNYIVKRSLQSKTNKRWFDEILKWYI